ncbi:MAG: hypothetical protein ACE149_09850 [Armatimonadota bacterium]
MGEARAGSEAVAPARGSRGPLIVIVLVLAVLAWVTLAWRSIGNRPRAWSYGSAPTVPAESYASTEPSPPASRAPKQVELPPPAGGQREGRQ